MSQEIKEKTGSTAFLCMEIKYVKMERNSKI